MTNMSIGAFTRRHKSAGVVRKKEGNVKDEDMNFFEDTDDQKDKNLLNNLSNYSSNSKKMM
jgi:hypothetical protein